MEIRKLSDSLSVADQITIADIATISRQGFKSIICNRPDNEETGQPEFADIQTAAKSAGLSIVFLPVVPKMYTNDDAIDLVNAVNANGSPVLAYCRTGTRCAILWAMGEASLGSPVEQILLTAKNAGYDLSKQRDLILSSAIG